MLSYLGFGKKEKKSDFEIVEEENDDSFADDIRINLTRLIAYAESSDVLLQREVAEKLANEAVKPIRQVQVVAFGGLRLLIPLTRSIDPEVQRLASHALANLSVNSDNQVLMAENGAIEALIALLSSTHELIQRQAAKALANLGVNVQNKCKIADRGGIPKLLNLARDASIPVKIESIAALANLAVNDANETEIVRLGGLVPIMASLRETGPVLNPIRKKFAKNVENLEELAAQCCRALRNLSVNPNNKKTILELGAITLLLPCMDSANERISQQAHRAMKNLNLQEIDIFAAAKTVKPENKAEFSSADAKSSLNQDNGGVLSGNCIKDDSTNIWSKQDEDSRSIASNKGRNAIDNLDNEDAQESTLWQRKDDDGDEK